MATLTVAGAPRRAKTKISFEDAEASATRPAETAPAAAEAPAAPPPAAAPAAAPDAPVLPPKGAAEPVARPAAPGIVLPPTPPVMVPARRWVPYANLFLFGLCLLLSDRLGYWSFLRDPANPVVAAITTLRVPTPQPAPAPASPVAVLPTEAASPTIAEPAAAAEMKREEPPQSIAAPSAAAEPEPAAGAEAAPPASPALSLPPTETPRQATEAPAETAANEPTFAATGLAAPGEKHFLIQFGAYHAEANAQRSCAALAEFGELRVASGGRGSTWFYCRSATPLPREEAATLLRRARSGAAPDAILVPATGS